jgi:5-methylcytosine-specific restriction endonuclease McrA
MTTVNLGNGISFSANNGVRVSRDVLRLTPAQLFDSISLAYSHMHDPVLVDAGCGGVGLLVQRYPHGGPVNYSDYLNVLSEAEVIEAAKLAKRNSTRRRRKDFDAVRDDLVLALLDSGRSHQCVGCRSTRDLTVDHIVPLSRGGVDALANLQFLCRSCNAQKGTTTLEGDTDVCATASTSVGLETQTQRGMDSHVFGRRIPSRWLKSLPRCANDSVDDRLRGTPGPADPRTAPRLRCHRSRG